MRAFWSGSISFGLVNVPVQAFSATDDLSFDLKMLHKKDLSPIHYAKICEKEGKEIDYKDIVKGVEVAKDEYVVLTEKDFERANVEKTKTIDIVQFVDEEEIDSLFFEKPYYLQASKGADHSYAVLRDSIQKANKVALVKFVFRNREHIGILKPHNKLLILNQLRYQSQVRDTDELKKPDAKPREQELKMALALIESYVGKFEPNKYHDTYKEDLEKIIQEKNEGKPIVSHGKEPIPTKVYDLMAVLKKSLNQQKKGVHKNGHGGTVSKLRKISPQKKLRKHA